MKRAALIGIVLGLILVAVSKADAKPIIVNNTYCGTLRDWVSVSSLKGIPSTTEFCMPLQEEFYFEKKDLLSKATIRYALITFDGEVRNNVPFCELIVRGRGRFVAAQSCDEVE